ncbi:MAG TPA: hypothetical protein VLM38_19035 [Blastocatellia bacterium]|nr:hypothetical protein [Blastocatellia bacterium]
MKKCLLMITIALFGVVAVGTTPEGTSVVFAQKRDRDRDGKKKDPPGPPVVKDKGKTEKPKEPPPKGKKPS